jgi:kynureninase
MGLLGMSRGSHFRILEHDSLGHPLGTLVADTYYDAALDAAKRFFNCSRALRISGWMGHAGTFEALNEFERPGSGARFYVERA